MSDKVKNIISNILGLLMSIISVYALVADMIEISAFLVLCVVGLALFLFKVSKTRDWLDKLFTSKLS